MAHKPQGSWIFMIIKGYLSIGFLFSFFFVPCEFESIQPFNLLTICPLQVLKTSTSWSSFHLSMLSEMFLLNKSLGDTFQIITLAAISVFL